MSEQGGAGNGIEARLLTDILAQVRETGGQVVDISGRLGHVEAECQMSREHLVVIDRRLEQGASQMHGYGNLLIEHGKTLEQFQGQLNEQAQMAIQRRHKCSEQMRQLGVRTEDTGKHLIGLDGEKRGLRRAAQVLLAVLALMVSAAGAFQLSQCIYGSAGKAAVASPVHGRR